MQTLPPVGENALEACGLADLLTGHVASQPDEAFVISGLAEYDCLGIRIEAERDAVLLLSDVSGVMRFNDDTNGSDPAISLDDPADGTYDLWLGSYAAQCCAATLMAETF